MSYPITYGEIASIFELLEANEPSKAKQLKFLKSISDPWVDRTQCQWVLEQYGKNKEAWRAIVKQAGSKRATRKLRETEWHPPGPRRVPAITAVRWEKCENAGKMEGGPFDQPFIEGPFYSVGHAHQEIQQLMAMLSYGASYTLRVSRKIGYITVYHGRKGKSRVKSEF